MFVLYTLVQPWSDLDAVSFWDWEPRTLFWGQVCTGVCCGFLFLFWDPGCVPRLASNLLGSKGSFELLILLPLTPNPGCAPPRCAPPLLVHTRGRAQNFTHARQAPSQPSYTPSPAASAVEAGNGTSPSPSESGLQRGKSTQQRLLGLPSLPFWSLLSELWWGRKRRQELWGQRSQEFAAFVLQPHLTTFSLRQEEMTHV